MVNEVMDFITAADPQVGQAIRAEYNFYELMQKLQEKFSKKQ